MSLAGMTKETYQHNAIALGGVVNTSNATLALGQNLVAGTVIGRVTASGELVQAVVGAVDGSDVPVGVLVHDIDASAAAMPCQVYVSGDLNASALTWDASFTAALQSGAFDGTPINLITPK